jgi:hypothetical protein
MPWRVAIGGASEWARSLEISSSFLDRKNWAKDNKKRECRELIHELKRATTRMPFVFPPVHRLASDESSDRKTGMGFGVRVMSNRIFLIAIIKKRGIVKKWEELGGVRFVCWQPQKTETTGRSANVERLQAEGDRTSRLVD